jgi:hypothetical protein
VWTVVWTAVNSPVVSSDREVCSRCTGGGLELSGRTFVCRSIFVSGANGARGAHRAAHHAHAMLHYNVVLETVRKM